MKTVLSLYLDIFRFLLSLAVLLSHATSMPYTGEIFWRAVTFAQPAVISFFVLSGFVIAYVTSHHERDLASYMASRISRLYSVVLPCLLLTAVIDAAGWEIFYTHYQHAPVNIGTDNVVMRYLLGTFMFTGMGIVGYFTGNLHVIYQPGTNGALWSLSNEIIYYLIFAVWLFGRSKKAYILYALIIVIAGPEVIALFPIWLMGVLAYQATRSRQPNAVPAVMLFLFTTICVLAIGLYTGSDFWSKKTFLGRAIHRDYAVGFLVAVNIYSISGLQHIENWFLPFKKLIRGLGAITFPLYLCHRPLLQFLSGYQLDKPGSLLQTTYLLGSIMIISALVTIISDNLHLRFRNSLQNIFVSKGASLKRLFAS